MYNISVKERSTGHIRQRKHINFMPVQGKDMNKNYQNGILQ